MLVRYTIMVHHGDRGGETVMFLIQKPAPKPGNSMEKSLPILKTQFPNLGTNDIQNQIKSLSAVGVRVGDRCRIFGSISGYFLLDVSIIRIHRLLTTTNFYRYCQVSLGELNFSGLRVRALEYKK